MFTLTPSGNSPDFSEDDADSPAALKKTSYANLRLVPATDGVNAVLICKVVLQLEFSDGVSEQPDTKGQPLVWTDAEKTAFSQAFVDATKKIWDFQFEIKGASGYFHRSAAAQMEIVIKTGATIFKHYHINVTKIDKFARSFVKGDRPIVGSDAELASVDVTGVTKGASMPQRGGPHEFGHMISYDDEYSDVIGSGIPTRPTSNANFLSDLDSIMNRGETLRKRHYTIFAAWLTKQYQNFTHTSIDKSDPIIWKVEGDTDLSNAQI
ncbi:MAG: hypothetical protein ABSH00_16775 [Bryobacteraceae bacterium]|jgi:hypothetical protein